MSRRLRWLAPFAALAALAVSCADDAPSGGLLLLITRDGPLPLERLDLTISSNGQVLHDTQYRVPEEAALPTTFGITSDGDATATVKITVTGWGDSAPLDRRDAIVTQVPTDRVALLKIVLSGRCSDKVTIEGGQAVSVCGDENTCDPGTGDCTSAVVDGKSLPTYQSGEDQSSGNGGAGGEPSSSSSGGAGAPAEGGGSASSSAGGAGASGAASEAGAGAGGEPLTCDDGYAECGGNRKDDCETYTPEDAQNCGACGKRCPANDGHAYCRDSKCGQTVCASPLVDCNKQPEDGCEIDTTASDKNCLGCGNECPDALPYCTPTGCAGNRQVVIVSSDKTGVFGWQEVPEGDAYRHTFKLPFTLQTPYREGDQGRLIIVGAVGESANLKDDSLTYADVPMHLATADQRQPTQGFIYYLLDTELPHLAGKYPFTLTVNAIPEGDVALHALELKNVQQETPVAIASGGQDGCTAQLGNINLPLSFSRLGAFTYAFASARGGYGPGTDTPGATEYSFDLDGFEPHISALTLFSNSGTTLHWGVEVCDKPTAVSAAVTFARYGIQGAAQQ